jgi:hypothetical protein
MLLLLMITMLAGFALAEAHPARADVPPPGLVIAYMGDGPRNDLNAVSVYRLVRDYGADAVIHSGDTDYDERPDWFERRIDETLGPMFPYFLSVGNHDDGPVWKKYAARFQARCNRIPQATCEGDYGINSVVRYRGLTVVLSGVNVMGSGHERYASAALSSSDSAWKVCSWHKRLTGNAVAEVCRQHGAFIINGHEHNYRRTTTLRDVPRLLPSTEFTDPGLLHLAPGATFMVWNGLGGSAITPATSCCSGAWVASYDAMHAVLFITYHVDGDPYKARGELVNVNGEVIDRFVVVTEPDVRHGTTTTSTTLATTTTTTTLPLSTVSLQIRVASGSDDAEENVTGHVNAASSDLEMVYSQSPQTVGIRFRDVDVPWGVDVTHAYVQFTVDEAPKSQSVPALTIHGQAAGDAPAFATTNGNLSERARTNARAEWQPAAWPTVKAAGETQRTSDLAAVIEEIVGGDAWEPGNALALLFTGTSKSRASSRIAEAYEGAAGAAPVLHLEYRAGEPAPTTTTTTPSTTTATLASTTTTTAAVPTTSSTTTTTLVPPQRLHNGDFEDGTTGWTGWNSAGNRGEVVRTNATRCTGSWSVQMLDSSGLVRSIHQDADGIDGGTRYAVSVLAATENLGTGQARVAVHWKAGNAVLAQDSLWLDAGSRACRRYEGVFVPPAGATHARVALELGAVTNGKPRNDATVWYDAVTLTHSP